METLNDDICIELILLLDINNIITLSEFSKYFYELCNSKTLRSKLYGRFDNDTLILDDFSLKELEFYSKIYLLKNRMNFEINFTTNLHEPDFCLNGSNLFLKNKCFTIVNNEVVKLKRENINKIVKFKKNTYLLTDEGQLFKNDQLFNHNNKLLVSEKIIDIYINMMNDLLL